MLSSHDSIEPPASRDRTVLVVASNAAPRDKAENLQTRGIEVVTTDSLDEGVSDFGVILALLHDRGIRSLMVLSRVAKEFMLSRLADYCVVTLVSSLGGSIGETANGGVFGISHGVRQLSLTDCQYHPLGRDMVVHGAL